MTQSKAKEFTADILKIKRVSRRFPYLKNCHGCNQAVEDGDECISKRSGKRAKWYHKKCAERVNII